MCDIYEHHIYTIELAISDFESLSMDDKTRSDTHVENSSTSHMKPRPPSMYSRFRSINGPPAHGSDPRYNPPFVSCADLLRTLMN